jgi:lysyl-tRNA synthetase class 1
MSTSKGLGAAAFRFTEIVPPEQTRFLFIRPRPETAMDFDPEGTDAVPRLFDEFDRLAAAAAGREVKGELPSGHESIFRYSLLDPKADVAEAAAAFRPAFGHLALLAQVPGVDVAQRVTAEKGEALTPAEESEFETRLDAVRRWLDAYAPERARIEIRRHALPVEAEQLRPEQRGFLRALADAAAHGDAPASGEQWQAATFAVAADHGLDAKAAFNALYLAFLGRPNGPRAGWLLASLDRQFVIARLQEAGRIGETIA